MKFFRLFIAVAATTAVSGLALVGCQTQGSTGADIVLLTIVSGKVVWAKAPFVGLAPQVLSQASASRSVQ